MDQNQPKEFKDLMDMLISLPEEAYPLVRPTAFDVQISKPFTKKQLKKLAEGLTRLRDLPLDFFIRTSWPLRKRVSDVVLLLSASHITFKLQVYTEKKLDSYKMVKKMLSWAQTTQAFFLFIPKEPIKTKKDKEEYFQLLESISKKLLKAKFQRVPFLPMSAVFEEHLNDFFIFYGKPPFSDPQQLKHLYKNSVERHLKPLDAKELHDRLFALSSSRLKDILEIYGIGEVPGDACTM